MSSDAVTRHGRLPHSSPPPLRGRDRERGNGMAVPAPLTRAFGATSPARGEVMVSCAGATPAIVEQSAPRLFHETRGLGMRPEKGRAAQAVPNFNSLIAS
jgi:hypothetical protein